MNDLDQLADRLHELTGVGTSQAPTQRLLERGRRSKHRRAAVTSASLAVLALGGVTAAVMATSLSGAADRPSTVANAADPRVELAAAIAASDNVSFRLKSTVTGQKGDGKTQTDPATYITQTAFDPTTATGYLRLGDSEIYRLVNGVLYAKNSPCPKPSGPDAAPPDCPATQWLQYPGHYASLNFDDDKLRGQFSASADSQTLFQALRADNAKVTKTGADTYHFEATGTKDGGAVTFTGDVTVGADDRIAKVTYDWKLKYAQGGFRTSGVVLEYSGYGDPVTVEAPPNPVPVS
jgi:hypothetical protein